MYLACILIGSLVYLRLPCLVLRILVKNWSDTKIFMQKFLFFSQVLIGLFFTQDFECSPTLSNFSLPQELAILHDTRRKATVISREPIELLVISKEVIVFSRAAPFM